MSGHLLISKPKLFVLVIFLMLASSFLSCSEQHKKPIKVGLINTSKSLPEVAEVGVIDAINLAIDEVNSAGGVLGHKIETVEIKAQPTQQNFAQHVARVFEEEQFRVLFGCQTSYVRKIIEPIAKEHQSLVVYSSLYKGLEQSNNIIYSGALPNQVISPTVKWATEQFGKRVLVIGSDYVFSHAVHTFIEQQLGVLSTHDVDSHYLPFGAQLSTHIIEHLANDEYDLVISTLVGSSNDYFLRFLTESGITLPLVTFSLTEQNLAYLAKYPKANVYLAANYFEQLDIEENHAFVSSFKKRYGQQRHITASMVDAYTGVKIWAKTAEKVRTLDPSTVTEALKGERYNSPEGLVSVSTMNNHFWKRLYLSKLNRNGRFERIEFAEQPIRPLPFPSYGTHYQWQNFLKNLYKEKGGVMPIPIISK